MRSAIRLGLAAGLAILPAAAMAQMIYAEPSVGEGEALVIPEPEYGEPEPYPEQDRVYAEDAREIAMENGLVRVDKIDDDWRHNYRVKGRDASGDRVVITIDKDTGEILEVDD